MLKGSKIYGTREGAMTISTTTLSKTTLGIMTLDPGCHN